MLDDENEKIENVLSGELKEKEEYIHFIMDVDDYLKYDDPDVYVLE